MENKCGMCDNKLDFWRVVDLVDCGGIYIEVCPKCNKYLKKISKKSLTNEEKDAIQAILETDCDIVLKQYLMTLLYPKSDTELKQVNNMDTDTAKTTVNTGNEDNLLSIRDDINTIKSIMVFWLVVQLIGAALFLFNIIRL